MYVEYLKFDRWEIKFWIDPSTRRFIYISIPNAVSELQLKTSWWDLCALSGSLSDKVTVIQAVQSWNWACWRYLQDKKQRAWLSRIKSISPTVPTLTAAAGVHVDLRTLHRRDDPLSLPRSRCANTVQLLLQNRPGFGHSSICPSRGREEPQNATSRFN